MSKTATRNRSDRADASEIRWIKLRDGRLIAEPPPGGGKLKRSDIARAVREVVEARLAASRGN